MLKTLDKTNSFNRLKIAYIYSSNEFRQHMLEYVCKPKSDGNFSEILSSSEWKAFAIENELVANDITMAVFANKKWFD